MCLLRGSRIPCVFVVLVVTGVESSRAQDEYEQWKKKEEASFHAYVEERDKEFVRFLQHEWKQMQVMNGLVTDETPKPPDIPVYNPVQETLACRPDSTDGGIAAAFGTRKGNSGSAG